MYKNIIFLKNIHQSFKLSVPFVYNVRTLPGEMHFVLSHTPFPLSYVPMINTAYSDEMTILQPELYIVKKDAFNLL